MAYTMPEIAARWHCSLLTVERAIAAGRLAAVKSAGRNGSVRVTKSALAACERARLMLATQTMSTAEVAGLIHESPRTVQRLVAAGQLCRVPAHGSGLRITRESVALYALVRQQGRAA